MIFGRDAPNQGIVLSVGDGAITSVGLGEYSHEQHRSVLCVTHQLGEREVATRVVQQVGVSRDGDGGAAVLKSESVLGEVDIWVHRIQPGFAQDDVEGAVSREDIHRVGQRVKGDVAQRDVRRRQGLCTAMDGAVRESKGSRSVNGFSQE
jgi:hypothetical protein